jgi:hypothetical protein
MDESRGRAIFAPVVGAIVVLTTLTAGINPWPQILGVGAVATLVLARRFGVARGVVAATVLVGAALFAAALIAPHFVLSLREVSIVCITMVGLGAVLGAWHWGPPPMPQLRRGLVTMAVACAGSAVWLVGIGIAQLVPSATSLGWAMSGDAAPHLIQSRTVLGHGGVDATLLADNPVPYLHGLLAQLATGEAHQGVLADQIALFAQTWAVLIALATLVGALAAREVALIAGARRSTGLIVAAVAAALGLTWFYVGYPVKFGFTNSHVVAILLGCTVIAAVHVRRSPWWALTCSAVVAVGMLATWSPLAVLPLAVGAVAAARVVVERARPGRLAAVTTVMAFAFAAGYAVLYQLPLLRAAQSALAVEGGLAFFPELMLPLALLWCALMAWVAFWRRDMWVLAALVTFLAVAAIGLVATVWLAGNPWLGPWTYYPQKFAWQVTATVGLIGWGLLGALADRVERGRWFVLGAPAALVALASGPLMLLPGSMFKTVSSVLVIENFLGEPEEDRDRHFDLVVAAEDAPGVVTLWATEEYFQGPFNHWRLQLAREGRDDATRLVLHVRSHFFFQVAEVCEAASVIPGELIVLTTDPDGAATIASRCPDEQIDVRYAPEWTPAQIAALEP